MGLTQEEPPEVYCAPHPTHPGRSRWALRWVRTGQELGEYQGGRGDLKLVEPGGSEWGSWQTRMWARRGAPSQGCSGSCPRPGAAALHHEERARGGGGSEHLSSVGLLVLQGTREGRLRRPGFPEMGPWPWSLAAGGVHSLTLTALPQRD